MIKPFFFYLIFQTIASGQNISFLLSDSIGEWKATGDLEVYIGEELFRLINGGADIFYEYGFKQVVTQRYNNPDDKIISVEIYEMIDSSAAFGIFSLFTFNTGRVIDFSSGASEGDEFLIFWKGNYYITLSGYEASKEIKDGFFLIAQSIENKINSAGRPGMINIFDPMGDVKPEAYQPKAERIAYLKGNLGLYNLSDLDLGKIFSIKEGIYFERDSVVNLIVKYKDEEMSNNEFLSLNQVFKKYPEYYHINSNISSQEGTVLLIKDRRDLYHYITQLHNYIIILIATDKTKMLSELEEVKNIIK